MKALRTRCGIRWAGWAISIVLASSCAQDVETSVSYTAYNDTDRGIISILVNGKGGALNARARGGGGEICCVTIPNQWHPGMKVTIKWKESGDFVRNERGELLRNDGVPVVIERPYKERTVEIPKYDNRLGRMNIHFLPNDTIKVVISLNSPGHRDYPIPQPIWQPVHGGAVK